MWLTLGYIKNVSNSHQPKPKISCPPPSMDLSIDNFLIPIHLNHIIIMIPRVTLINVRSFSSVPLALNRSKKTLAQKIFKPADPSKIQANLDYKRSTKLYFNWLFNNPKKLLTKYEDSLIHSLNLPENIKFEKKTVAGLHQLHFKNELTDKKLNKIPTVMIHGFAASGVFYHRNFHNLTDKFEHLYTLDMPSVGLSDAKALKVKPVKYNFKLEPNTGKYEIEFEDKKEALKILRNTEDYYIERIEQWRQANNLGKINLVSHSFGALLSSKYSLKYPQHVNKFVLVSPVGVEKSVFSINNKSNVGVVQTSHPDLENYYKPTLIPNFVLKCGFGITKLMGPFGINLISKYLSMRYTRSATDLKQIDDFIHYTIILFYQRSNSLQNLNVLLNNRLLAFDPIMDTVDRLKMPLLFIYGQFDWMNSNAGFFAAAKADQGRFKIIEKSGHNVFLDNPKAFNSEIIDFLTDS